MAYRAEDTDPRTLELMGALVKHLHDFARETKLTHEEWRAGIAFLEGFAAIETEDRHEFVLASDAFGMLSLVDMISSREDATSSSVLGPFHVAVAPPLAYGGDMKHQYGGPVLLAEGVIRRSRAAKPAKQPMMSSISQATARSKTVRPSTSIAQTATDRSDTSKPKK
jgi:hydroxyquinol 1,2-dioxygenase